MIDIDIARRLRDAGLAWEPADGDWFVVDNEQLRDEPFMLSSMVIERGTGRTGGSVFRFNGTTEWALDSVEQYEAVWIPREDQLREALGEAFRELRHETSADGEAYVVRVAGSSAASDGAPSVDAGSAADGVREVRAPSAEDAYAGALLIALTDG